ncbi:hypothetical protein D2T29_12560 [Sinirhodobacter populi]|uniref:Uncharacterized protein n=1 Tax=Paenirhodobacter populi TaxID=2306993 RepID=A0A443KCS6_9RHOB|nr:hypothetical protein D2T29_12560 [Sinirhodobacter populi]
MALYKRLSTPNIPFYCVEVSWWSTMGAQSAVKGRSMFGFFKRTIKAKGSRKLQWFRPHVAWGTVYLFSQAGDNKRIKLGFTQRLTTDRRSEVQRYAGDNLRIITTVHMPHAFCLEGRILKRVRTVAKPDRSRSSEWFILRDGASLEDVCSMVLLEAILVRRAARWRLAWPKYGRITVFDSGFRGSHCLPRSKYDVA